MNNDELIRYGLNHGDSKVRELAELFDQYRKVVSRFVGSQEPIKLNSLYGKFGDVESSGERTPMYDTPKWLFTDVFGGKHG